MWVSKKKWNQLEKRIADLEAQVQGQQEFVFDKEKFAEAFKQAARQEQRLRGWADVERGRE